MISSPDPLDDEFPEGDGTADTEAEVKCPYCGETVEIALDPGGGPEQEYVEDCHVCCRPWQVRVTYNDSGTAEVEVEAGDDQDAEE
ncbi:MAG: CPXCG motif-containing cysteine-rich protein [Gemmatimonadales bacterium]